MRADGGEQFSLLDRINPQVRFQVEVQVEHLGRVAGLLADYRQDVGLISSSEGA